MNRSELNKAINRLIEMSAEGGLTGTYDNNVISINFKVLEKFESRESDDSYSLWYITEVNASPAECKIKLADVKEVKHYKPGEFEKFDGELIRFTFVDDSELEFFEDYR